MKGKNTMKKNVFGFSMEKVGQNCVGDCWRGWGYIGKNFYFADSIFNGYAKKDIARILKNRIIEKAGFKV